MGINLKIGFDHDTLNVIERALCLLTSSISGKDKKIMSTLQEIVDDVAAESTAIGSLSVFVKGLQDQIAAIPGITPEMQTNIDGIFASVEANKAAINAAMAPAIVPPPIVVPAPAIDPSAATV